jgi:hypothetical protein
MFFRIVRRAGVVVLSVSIAILGYELWRVDKYARGFDTLHLGSSAEEVEALLGRPGDITDCSPETFSRYGLPDKQIPGCVRQFWYRSFFFAEVWLYAFNDEGKVVFQYDYSSP